MAPTVCLSELSIVRDSEKLCSHRQQKNYNCVNKQQRLESKRLINVITPLTESKNSSLLWEVNKNSSNAMSSTNSYTIMEKSKEHHKIVLTRSKGLLNIIIETMALVRRSHVLQKQVKALRAETQEFMKSVLNNPENRHKQNLLVNYYNDATVSSSTEMVTSKTVFSTHTTDLISSSTNAVTSTCNDPSWDKKHFSEDYQVSLSSV